MGAELFHADGQTYRYHEAGTRFWQFCEFDLNLLLSTTRNTVMWKCSTPLPTQIVLTLWPWNWTFK